MNQLKVTAEGRQTLRNILNANILTQEIMNQSWTRSDVTNKEDSTEPKTQTPLTRCRDEMQQSWIPEKTQVQPIAWYRQDHLVAFDTGYRATIAANGTGSGTTNQVYKHQQAM